MLFSLTAFLCCIFFMAHSGWLEELQLLGYMDPLSIPIHVGVQTVLVTIEPIDIHKFIQEHDILAMKGTKQNPGTLFLETLNI